jgi:hypothetical protein
MSNHLNTAEQYRQWVEQCVAMAKAATSNKMRAHHYATALNYLKLAEGEAKSARRPDGVLSSRLQALVQLSRPVSGFAQNLGKPSDTRQTPCLHWNTVRRCAQQVALQVELWTGALVARVGAGLCFLGESPSPSIGASGFPFGNLEGTAPVAAPTAPARAVAPPDGHVRRHRMRI